LADKLSVFSRLTLDISRMPQKTKGLNCKFQKTKELRPLVSAFLGVLPAFFRHNLLRIVHGLTLIATQGAVFQWSVVSFPLSVLSSQCLVRSYRGSRSESDAPISGECDPFFEVDSSNYDEKREITGKWGREYFGGGRVGESASWRSVVSQKFVTHSSKRQTQILRSPPPTSTPRSKDRSLGSAETFGAPFAQNDSWNRNEFSGQGIGQVKGDALAWILG
jgi:hypothetical protein